MEALISPSFVLVSTACALAASLALNVWLYKKQLSSPYQESRVLSLPDGWWSDPARFQAERRAIFSQAWMCVSHRGRFQKAGDYIVHDVAGFRFFMILGKDLVVRSFHNVCRHRAFPVARKQAGSATVLGCRYHGWSYDTTGRLVKAPYFDSLPGFDRSQNHLFEIHTKQDAHGFLHINVSTQGGVSKTAPPKGTKIGKVGKISVDSKLLHTVQFNSSFNWKVMLNNQPSGPTLQSQTLAGELDFFPLTTVHTMAGRAYWYQLTYSPDAAEQTTVRCDVYANPTDGNLTLEGTIKQGLEKDIQARISDLEAEHRRLVASGCTANGNIEQAKIADIVETHLRKEAIRGAEIKPASVTTSFEGSNNRGLTKADKICKAVECGTDSKLDW